MATITKRGNSYRIRAYAGYNTEGKQIERSMTWTPPPNLSETQAYKEALRQSVLFEEKIKYCDNCDGRIRFADFAELWFTDYAEPNLRPRTVARYRELMKRINPALGHISLEKIRPTHLLAFYKALEDEGEVKTYTSIVDLKATIKARKMTKTKFSEQCGLSLNTLNCAFQKKNISITSVEKICAALGCQKEDLFRPTEKPKKLSPTTIQRYHRLISDILNDAVNWQYITSNPCSRITPPKAATAEIVYLDDVQAKHFVELINKEIGYYRRPVLVLLLTGLRRSEVLGLEWKDVNWEGKSIRICRTSQFLSTKGVFTEQTKNKTSNRVVYVSDQVLNILREQYLWQQMQTKLPGHTKPDHDRIFTNIKGSPMHPDTLTQWFSRFVKKTDLPANLHLHSLRHTYATLCIAKSVPISAVSAQLGHSSTATTATIYTHAVASTQVAAAAQIGELFANIL